MPVLLILEDNNKQAEYLKKNLKTYVDNLEVIIAGNSRQAFEYAISNKIDLFICDIGLPDKSGLEFAGELRKLTEYKYTWIIFITAYGQYLPEAVKKIHCYDYITKPYDIGKITTLINELARNKVILQDNTEEDKLVLNYKNILYSIAANQILFIEVNQKICYIHTYLHTYDIKRLTLEKAFSQLSKRKFIQCHKSIVVNIDYINYINKDIVNWEISLMNYPLKLPVGEKFKEGIANAILSLTGTEDKK